MSLDEIFLIREIHSYPMIIPIREIAESDFAPVTERENSIRFILDDDPWEDDNSGGYEFKIRLRYAKELDTHFREKYPAANVGGEIFECLARLSRVYRTKVYHEDNKEVAAANCYREALAEINKAIIDMGSLVIFKSGGF